MTVQKWNYKKNGYDQYELPDGCFLYSIDMDKIVACCHCGEKHTFGSMYTSREVHNNMGLGFPVCEKCYQLENNRYNDDKGRETH